MRPVRAEGPRLHILAAEAAYKARKTGEEGFAQTSSEVTTLVNDADLAISATTSQYVNTYFRYLNPSRQWLERTRLVDPKSKAELVQYNMAIAMAARSMMDTKVMRSCEMRARALAADIYDDFTLGSIRAFSMLMYFYWGQDSRLSLHYRNIALSLCNCLKQQKSFLQLEGPRAQAHSIKSLVALENAGRSKSEEEVTPLKLLELEMFVANWNDVDQKVAVHSYDSTLDHLRDLVRKSNERCVVGNDLDVLDTESLLLLRSYINKNFDKSKEMEASEASALLQMLISSEQIKREFSPILQLLTEDLYAPPEKIMQVVTQSVSIINLAQYARTLFHRMQNHYKMLLYCYHLLFEKSMLPMISNAMLTMRAVVQLAIGSHQWGAQLSHTAIIKLEESRDTLVYSPPLIISILHLLIQGLLKHRYLELANRVSGLQRIVSEVLPRMKQMMWDDMTLLKEAARQDSADVRATPPPAVVPFFVSNPTEFVEGMLSGDTSFDDGLSSPSSGVRPSPNSVFDNQERYAMSSPSASSPPAPMPGPLLFDAQMSAMAADATMLVVPGITTAAVPPRMEDPMHADVYIPPGSGEARDADADWPGMTFDPRDGASAANAGGPGPAWQSNWDDHMSEPSPPSP
eukprot:CAMPEP_0114627768 /NCGR_PEP_ID=MMETSP0168-20121206/12470_1 /TAXON_ID=95228 ORGANISM="Vannella sp., Strain DIVA3 517/6/12" /NCGR_SAMPLE_ID=MMETSP0168 /ASSEMBLY_ACC=CAM_ASM_000044 /LENGTH=630 /DNA_ID=CAMNT_0001839119 /DNA_START=68 /DNA_END=1957 /DNA_ORIENTATION=-